MGQITDSIKTASVNGKVTLEKAVEIAQHADDLLARALVILNDVYKSHGLFIQGDIDMLKADVTRVKAKNQVYFHDKEPDGQ
jgi:hypothetical protein